jgi:uncharacterized membrane protein
MENLDSTGKSAIGLDANLAAALGYPIGILGLVNFFMDKDNKFVKFHGIQSVLYSVAIGVLFTVIAIVFSILGIVLSQVSGALAALFSILWILIFLAFMLIWFGGLLFFAYKSYQGQTFKVPVVGNFAEKITG